MRRAVIAALLCVLGLAAVAGWAATSAATPLRIELSSPTMCEAGDADKGETAQMFSVEWQVVGGTAPYRVAVGDTLSDKPSGVAHLTCGRGHGITAASEVMPIQARVVDAAGRAATAISNVYVPQESTVPPSARPVPNGLSAADSSDLRVTLTAPAICEASYRGWPFSYTSLSIDVDWAIRGGTPPYRVQFGQREFEGASGTFTTSCALWGEMWSVDSQVMNVHATVFDSDGRIASAVVSTYAIASDYYRDWRLRGGRTYRMEGLLMAIPEGLEFDVSTIGELDVMCSSEPLPDGSVCEGGWSMHTLGGSVWVFFGDITKRITSTGIDKAKLAADPGVAATSKAEVEQLLSRLADSVGQPPVLPKLGFFNPAPLSLQVWPDPPTCSPAVNDDVRRASVSGRASGGYWWPLGSGSRVLSHPRNLRFDVTCGEAVGWYMSEFEVHDFAPTPASATARVFHPVLANVAPPSGRVLSSGALASPAALAGWHAYLPYLATNYCAPGDSRRVQWNAKHGVWPYFAAIDGADLEVTTILWENSRYGAATDAEVARAGENAETEAWVNFQVTCGDSLGYQVFQLEIWDSADPVNRVAVPIVLLAVREHPSGRDWSEFE